MWLDVSISNSKAKNLYEKVGFRTVRKIQLFPFLNIGVFRMKKELS